MAELTHCHLVHALPKACLANVVVQCSGHLFLGGNSVQSHGVVVDNHAFIVLCATGLVVLWAGGRRRCWCRFVLWLVAFAIGRRVAAGGIDAAQSLREALFGLAVIAKMVVGDPDLRQEHDSVNASFGSDFLSRSCQIDIFETLANGADSKGTG